MQEKTRLAQQSYQYLDKTFWDVANIDSIKYIIQNIKYIMCKVYSNIKYKVYSNTKYKVYNIIYKILHIYISNIIYKVKIVYCMYIIYCIFSIVC